MLLMWGRYVLLEVARRLNLKSLGIEVDALTYVRKLFKEDRSYVQHSFAFVFGERIVKAAGGDVSLAVRITGEMINRGNENYDYLRNYDLFFKELDKLFRGMSDQAVNSEK